jgi:hypothetical protein
MFNSGYALPELLDAVLEHLGRDDLYNCSFVNKQFRAHVPSFLYRELSFTFYVHGDHGRQKKLLRRLRGSRHLAAHIRRLKIRIPCVLVHYNEQNELPYDCEVFGEEIVDILRNTTQLEWLEFNDERLGASSSQSQMDTLVHYTKTLIFIAVSQLNNIPKLSLDLGRSVVTRSGHYDFEGRALLVQLLSSRVYELTVPGVSLTRHPSRLTRFPQLRKLEIQLYLSPAPSDPIDFEAIFDGVPLTNMGLDCNYITSLPRTVQHLRFGSKFQNIDGRLCQTGWAAICRLEHLSTLAISYSSHKSQPWDGPPMPFKSSNLTSLKARFDSAENPAKLDIDWLTWNIFDPIFTHGHLETIEVGFWNETLSPNFIASTFCESLSSIEIRGRNGPRTYRFVDLVVLLRITPNLQVLEFPWPTSATVEDYGSRFTEPLEELTLQHCQHMSFLCPQLDIVRIVIGNDPTNFDEPWLLSQKTTSRSRLEASGYHCRQARKAEFFQSFKMRRLIDYASPCLNFCTIFYFDLRGGPTLDEDYTMTLYLSLNQVRRHGMYLYFPLSCFLTG